MQQTKQAKVFAFKLAEQKQVKQQDKLQVRQGVTASGCTGPDTRASFNRRRDNGYYC